MTAGLGHDESAPMGGGAVLLRGGDVEKLDWLRHGLARRHVDERAVLEERGIQRGEGVGIGAGVAEKVFFDERGGARERGRKVHYLHPVLQLGTWGMLRR